MSLPPKQKILAVCSVGFTAWVLLRQWFIGLQQDGYEVHIACSRDAYFERLVAQGFQVHPVPFRRTFAPWAHFRAGYELWKLIRKGGFEVVNTHTPLASAVGRIAAWMGGCRTSLYSVHGFYFHDNMPAPFRWLFIAIEWMMGGVTRDFMFVSEEDRRTAIRLGIVRAGSRSITLFNGVDLDAFCPRESCAEQTMAIKRGLGIPIDVPVVGIVGRIVREKGHREFVEMAADVLKRHTAMFLVVGDTLPSDRDQFGAVLRNQAEKAGLKDRFIFTGQTDRVADYLKAMDIFVLPSYREGFPVSIVEAMSAGVPVVATDIRGCREAVVDGKSGLIIPPRDARALSVAVEYLLTHPEEAREMGRAGRQRAVERYDAKTVQRRYVEFVRSCISGPCEVVSGRRYALPGRQ